MLQEYLPILIFIVIASGLGAVLISVGHFLSPSDPNYEKSSPYECGFEAFDDARSQFDIRFYLVAITFIIFDLEIAFMIPWAIALEEIGMQGFWAMMVFLALLTVGLVFEWRRGALDW